ncbi:hypothetical protein lerEdw1_016233 [Lerista edwardsae]|nr:hypothetical protein lerEdw1_016233 [Lerista edwardsae]
MTIQEKVEIVFTDADKLVAGVSGGFHCALPAKITGILFVTLPFHPAYFAMQVIYVRRKCKVPPPATSGSPEFERIFRAQANCSEYFPIFLSVLWVAGVFFHQALAAFCGIVYLYARYLYFTGYARSAQER